MAHEIGHALGWGHSWGVETGEYGDPYCIMSAEEYGNTNPTHRRTPPTGSAIPTIYGRNFWEGFGPMPAAATLSHVLPEFASSSMVVRIKPDQRVRLHALSEARRGDPVLAVMDLWGYLWMAEVRVATNWDAGLDGRPGSPCPAVVMHSSEERPNRGAVYAGRIDLRDRRSTFFQPEFSARMKLILDYYDPVAHTVEVRFSERDAPYAVGGPAPEFAPLAIDSDCNKWAGEYEIEFSEAYNRARSTARARARVDITVHDASGKVRSARSKVLRRDDSSGGVIAAASECKDGRVVGHWTANFVEGTIGNLEVVARVGDRLFHYWRQDTEPWTWQGTRFPAAGFDGHQIAAGVSGTPVLIQSRHGHKGNFEVVAPRAEGGLMHVGRRNDGDIGWGTVRTFGEKLGQVDAVSMIQSNFGTKSYVTRINGLGADGLVGSLTQQSNWVAFLPNGSTITLQSWGLPSIS